MGINKYIFTFFVTLIFIDLSFAQDTLYFTNNTTALVKLIEINPTFIIYKNLEQTPNKIDTVLKNKIAKIVFQNGMEEIISRSNTFLQSENKTIYEPQISDTTIKFSDYIKFSVDVGIIINSCFSNVPLHFDVGVSGQEAYKKISGKQYVSPNIGFAFLFGKSKYVNHIIAANYNHSKGSYYYNSYSPFYKIEGIYNSDIDFVNLISGLRITFFKKLHFEPLIAFNLNVKNKTTFTGYETKKESSFPYQQTTITHTNTTSKDIVGNTISLCPKLSYQISNRFLKSEIYIGYNIGIEYRLPWYQFGVKIYPIKKMR